MDDITTSGNTAPVTRTRRTGLVFGGTVLILIAGGITMQVWRAQSSQAAEQKE
jgi:hypothetical protein